MCSAGPRQEIQIDIIVPNQTRYLSLIGKIGEEIANELGRYSGDRDMLAFHLNLVLTEAMANAINHATADDADKTVRVNIHFEQDELSIKVYDHGQGFDLDDIPPPDLEHPQEHGRGIFLIRTLMDSVDYQKTETGNMLVMRKNLN